MKRHLIRDTWQTVCDYFDADDSEADYVSDEEINRVVIHVILGLIFHDIWVTKQYKSRNYGI